jgi:hypothetical protein
MGVYMRIRVGALGLFCAGALGAATASAAEPPPPILAQLDYRGPRDLCPAERALRREVEVRLGYDTFSADAPLRVVAVIEHQGRMLSGEIAVFTDGKKDEWSKSFRVGEGACAALLVKMGIAISFYLDPLIFSAEPAQKVPPADPPTEQMERVEVHPPPPAQPRPKLLEDKPRVSIDLGLGPQLAIGAGGPAVSMLGHAGARWSMLSLGLELRYDAPWPTEIAASPSGLRAKAGSLGGSLVPCVHVAGFFGCALLSGGQIAVDVSGGEAAHDHLARRYLGAGPRLGFEKRFLPWLGLRLHGEALFMRETFELAATTGTLVVPAPLASRVNGAVGASVLTYFSP